MTRERSARPADVLSRGADASLTAAAGVSCRITKTDAVLASGTVDLQVASDGHGQSARITAGRVTLAYQPPTEVPPQR